MIRNWFSAVLASACLAASVQAAGWGDFKGQFVFSGDAPKPEAIAPDKDQAVCAKKPLVKEDLVVDAKSGGVANVVLWLQPAAGAAVPVHDDLKAAAAKKVVLDNSACRFEPHVLALVTGQSLELKNSDAAGHNTNISSLDNPAINPILPAGGSLDHVFKSAENLPVNVSCSIHSWMNAKVVVKDHPYVAVTGTDGKFALKNVPAGDWTFRLWHEKGGYIKEIDIGGKSEKLTGGKYKVTITDGKPTDMGVVKVKL